MPVLGSELLGPLAGSVVLWPMSALLLQVGTGDIFQGLQGGSAAVIVMAVVIGALFFGLWVPGPWHRKEVAQLENANAELKAQNQDMQRRYDRLIFATLQSQGVAKASLDIMAERLGAGSGETRGDW
jgi:hypothetical protein